MTVEKQAHAVKFPHQNTHNKTNAICYYYQDEMQQNKISKFDANEISDEFCRRKMQKHPNDNFKMLRNLKLYEKTSHASPAPSLTAWPFKILPFTKKILIFFLFSFTAKFK